MAVIRKDSDGVRRIDGEGVFLRAPEAHDYEDWAELREASRAYLTPWEPAWGADEHARASFRYKLRRYSEDARDDKAYAFFVFRQDDGAFTGAVMLANVRRGVAQAASIGYWTGQAYTGRGYTTAAARAAVRYCFSVLDLHRVEAACQPENAASRKVLVKAGFSQDGLARAYLKIDGQWRDHLLFSIVNQAD